MDPLIIEQLIEELARLTETLRGRNEIQAEINSDAKKLASEEKKARGERVDEEKTELTEEQKRDKEKADLATKRSNLEKKLLNEEIARNEYRVKSELENLGLAKNAAGQLQQITDKRVKTEQLVLDELKKQLGENPALQKKFGLDEKAYKLSLDQDKLFRQQLASLNRILNENGKLTDSTIRLTKEQESSIRKVKAEEEARNQLTTSMDQFKTLFTGKGIVIAVAIGFEFLSAQIKGTYQSLIAYQNALLDGVKGQNVDAAAYAVKQNALADSISNLSSGMTSFASMLGGAAATIGILGLPVSGVAIAISAVVGAIGMLLPTISTAIKRDVELNSKRSALFVDAYQDFLKLGEASVTGARGVEGLVEDLHS